MEKKLMITNIQRMCFHDGPGIRTTVFIKGCSLHCPWCSNPENINFVPEEYEKDGFKGIYGKEYVPDELIEILLKDKDFWEEDGGVTFSGGEALMQVEGLEAVLRKLKAIPVHTVIETALFVPEGNLLRALPYIDYVIADVKILDSKMCREVLGGELELYLDNVRRVYKSGKLKLFRVPCCGEYTFTEDNQKRVVEFLRNYPEIPVQVFAIHSLGEGKYQSLGRSMWKAEKLERQRLKDFCRELAEHGICAEVIEI